MATIPVYILLYFRFEYSFNDLVFLIPVYLIDFRLWSVFVDWFRNTSVFLFISFFGKNRVLDIIVELFGNYWFLNSELVSIKLEFDLIIEGTWELHSAYLPKCIYDS